MPNLVIDIGNTRTKIAVFQDRKLLFSDTEESLKLKKAADIIERFKITDSILSSVAAAEEEVGELLEKHTRFIRFSHQYPAAVQINYKTPETLGLDRLAGVIGAMAVNADRTSLVIDCGTCITMDAVTGDGQYSGGSISPGLRMRLKALNAFTGRLPLVEPDDSFSSWQGTDTRDSILAGVLEGAFQEVLGFVAKYNSHYAGLQVLLCGGDADFFDRRLKNSIFAGIVKTEPALILIGLNEVIHHYND